MSAIAMNDGDATHIAVALVVVVVGVTWFLAWGKQKSRRGEPPRVAGLPMVGSAIEFGKDCRGFLRKHFKSTPIFTARIAGKDYHFIDSSFADFSVERLFRQPHLSFTPVANDAVQYGFGASPEAMACNGGPDGEGKEMNAIFHKHLLKLDGLEPLVHKVQLKLQTELASEKMMATHGLYELVNRILFCATVGTVVSPELATSSALQSFRDFDSKFPYLVGKLPVFLFPAAKRGRDSLNEACQSSNVLASQSKAIVDRHGTLTRLGMKERKDFATFDTVVVWAAAANTIPSGFWCLYHILADKTAYNAIVQEIQNVMKDRPDPTAPLTLKELDGMVGLDSCLQEAFRLYSESMIARDVMQDTELDLKISNGSRPSKYSLQKGSRVAVMMSLLHTDESVFHNASEFQWDRFCPVNGEPPVFSKDGKTLAQPVRPFGGGSSMCPGRKFASYEIKAFIAWLLHRCNVALLDPCGPKPEIDTSRVGLGINVPANDVQVRIGDK